MPPRSLELHPRVARALLALVTVTLLLAVVEVTLRLSGFEFHLHPEDLEFGKPDPVLIREAFRPDPDLYWVTPEYRETLDELARQGPPLLLLGDSCTQLGHYDEALAAWALQHRGRRLRYGNLAVAGWSTYQGRIQVERDLPALGPKVVTAYFGWNDHWVGFGFEDAEAARWQRFGASAWGDLRWVQLVLRSRVALGERPLRVPLPAFRENLEAIVSAVRLQDAVPFLLTAPDDHRRGAEPEYLGTRWLRDLDELVPLHERYVAAVREVAEATGAPLCDLAAAAEELPPALRSALFRQDGIHLTAAGDEWVAEEIALCFEARGLWDDLLEAPA